MVTCTLLAFGFRPQSNDDFLMFWQTMQFPSLGEWIWGLSGGHL